MVIERAGDISDAGELTLVLSGKNKSSKVLKWSLFSDEEPSEVSVLLATWIPGAGSDFFNQTRQTTDKIKIVLFLSVFLPLSHALSFHSAIVAVEQNICHI